MDMIDFIKRRRSIGKLSLPAPTQYELNDIFACAMSAPDHKQLFPYRFTVLQSASLEQLGQRLQQAVIERARRLGEQADEMACLKALNMPKRAPMIIAVTSDYRVHDKVPKHEQLLCIGAVVQNLLLALQAKGYQSIWRTGELCDEPAVKQFLNVNDDNVVCGLIYVGSSDVVMPARQMPILSDFVIYR